MHVIQRGNNRQALFTSDADMAVYANWLGDGALRFQVEVLGWVLMTNHVHLLLRPRADMAVSRLMQSMGRRYVAFFNYSYARSGTLFEGRYRSCLVQEDEYFLACLSYIELNPVRAGMVRDPGDYRWSSYRAHAFGAPVKFWTAHDLYLALGENSAAQQMAWRKQVGEAIDMDTIAKIRHCTNTGLVLGTEKFRDQVAALRS
ncbi:MAG: transposase [Xanthomonadales bacterium]|nr:transposase [Gammaproteobacteria bacterium]NND55785.1 transposase [Xanthomonadales bacterium]NNK50049.1 transposase [Xanthomonadales bacterium]